MLKVFSPDWPVLKWVLVWLLCLAALTIVSRGGHPGSVAGSISGRSWRLMSPRLSERSYSSRFFQVNPSRALSNALTDLICRAAIELVLAFLFFLLAALHCCLSGFQGD